VAWRERVPYDRLVEWRLELVSVPVSDIDRARTFYGDQAGFHADLDTDFSDDVGMVHLTPPGFRDPDGSGWVLQQSPRDR
jgi:catechol 2,3-dioxygenase-like lactoylglutathione lyase family enzyme